MIEVNGKEYPLWSQFVEGKEKWIGGRLEDSGDSMDRHMGLIDNDLSTEIIDIILRPNGETSAWFEVKGKDFSCGFDISCGGIGAGKEGWLTFHGYMGHEWRIKEKTEIKEPFSSDDRGNVVDFYELCEDGSYEPCGHLDREAGESGNELGWINDQGIELENWARKNGYDIEISEALLKETE